MALGGLLSADAPALSPPSRTDGTEENDLAPGETGGRTEVARTVAFGETDDELTNERIIRRCRSV